MKPVLIVAVYRNNETEANKTGTRFRFLCVRSVSLRAE